MSDPVDGNAHVKLKRRRTRLHRRNRAIRRLLFTAVAGVFAAVLSASALRYFGSSLFSHKQTYDFASSRLIAQRQAELDELLSKVQPSRPIYPYSVVPGGVEDAKELKWVAEHDPIVAAHYAGFDYDHARVVRLTLARTAFVSYRIGNHIYWMHRRITLHKGETVITDGHITARGRCANRVEEKPQQEAASPEPAPEKFDQPIASGAGTATQSPAVPFESALLTRPQPGLDPSGPMSLYSPFSGGNFIPFSPPALPEGLCAPVKKGNSNAAASSSGGKKKPGPCGSGGTGTPSNVPEPSTWVMLISGLTFIGWQARRKFAALFQ